MERLAPGCSFIQLGVDLVCVENAEQKSFLHGSLVCSWIASLAEGKGKVATAAELAKRFSSADVERAYQALVLRGYVLENSREPETQFPFWSCLGLREEAALERLRRNVVAVTSSDREVGSRLSTALRGLGVALTDDPDECDVVAVVIDSLLSANLKRINEDRCRDLRRWIPVQPRGVAPTVGPLFRPESGPCWLCMEARLGRNLQIDAFLLQRADALILNKAKPSEPLPISIDFCAFEITKALAGRPDMALSGTIARFDLRAMTSTRHHVDRRPQCPACGDHRLRDPARVPPRLCFDLDQLDASLFDPIDTVRIDPLTGLVMGLKSEAGPIPGFYSCLAFHNIDPRPHTYADLQRSLRHASAGRGRTPEQARTRALGEAVERMSCVFQGDECRRSASLRQLGTQGLDPRSCMLYSERQYAKSGSPVRESASPWFVPRRFEEDAVLEWTELQSPWSTETAYLPTPLLYSFYEGERGHCCVADSNGVAAGRTFREAFVAGLLELVERDCLAMWWYNRVPRPAILVEGEDGCTIRSMLDNLAAIGRTVHLLDITNDLGVPAVAAVSVRRVLDRVVVDLGSAASFEPSEAAYKALRELCGHIGTNGDRMTSGGSDLGPVRTADWAYLEPQSGRAKAPAIEFDLEKNEIDAFQACQQLVRRSQLSVYALNCTRPDIGIPVVRVVVPGLRSSLPRFAPGRLFDVPVALGWLEERTPEHALNDVSPV